LTAEHFLLQPIDLIFKQGLIYINPCFKKSVLLEF
jgi:hypothetical protein